MGLSEPANLIVEANVPFSQSELGAGTLLSVSNSFSAFCCVSRVLTVVSLLTVR